MPISTIFDKRILLVEDTIETSIDGATLKVEYEAELTTEYSGMLGCIDNSADIVSFTASIDDIDIPEDDIGEIIDVLSDSISDNMDRPIPEILDEVEEEFKDSIFYNLSVNLKELKERIIKDKENE